MKIVAMVHDQMQIARYLKHLGLSAHPPPVAPARYDQQEWEFGEAHPAEDEQDHPEYY